MSNELILIIMSILGALAGFKWLEGRDRKRMLDKRRDELKEQEDQTDVVEEQEEEIRSDIDDIDRELEEESDEEVDDADDAADWIRGFLNDSAGEG